MSQRPAADLIADAGTEPVPGHPEARPAANGADVPASRTDACPVPIHWIVLDGFAQRLRGLLWRPPPLSAQAWCLPRCAAVHTWGMAYPIDIVFVAGSGEIRRVDAAVPPWRWRGCPGAWAVVELAAGEAERLGWRRGGRVAWPAGLLARRAVERGSAAVPPGQEQSEARHRDGIESGEQGITGCLPAQAGLRLQPPAEGPEGDGRQPPAQ